MTDFPKEKLDAPILLNPDNFTDIHRTPWAGEFIGKLFKDELVPAAKNQRIGESWEFSCDPSQPSKVQGSALTLQDLVAKFPAEILGPKLINDGCQILVKLLNASQPLSLQVHPADDDPALKPNECGKPETWLILHVESGSGLYLGFNQKINRKELQAIIEKNEGVDQLLNFVPVKSGDFFEIEPGVPHAIGPGVTLLEPQRVLLGKSGKTYRMWDWGRKREMHLREALSLVDPEKQVGAAFVDKTRRKAEVKNISNSVTCLSFPKNPYYQVHVFEWFAPASIKLEIKDGYGALTMLGGKIETANLKLMKGQSALIPYAAHELTLTGEKNGKFALVIPSISSLTVS